jgi:NAD dependent epimerase/dehydratase family enzyme
MSWIALDDAIGCIHHALATESLRGPVNAVGPKPVTNLEFTKTLGRVLARPTIFPVPGFMARLAFGEMANDLLLASTRVLPKALLESGYQFMYPDLEHALRHLLGNCPTGNGNDSIKRSTILHEAGTSA